jgi:hypothetical protein
VVSAGPSLWLRGIGSLFFAAQTTDGICRRSWIYVCDSSAPLTLLCRQRLYKGTSPSFKESYQSSVNFTQKLLWAAITPMHGMETSRIRATWKTFYRPGHILYSVSVIATCSLSTICRSLPCEVFLVSCNSEFVFVISQIKSTYKWNTVWWGLPWIKYYEQASVLAAHFPVAESDFKKWKSVFSQVFGSMGERLSNAWRKLYNYSMPNL